MADISKIIVDGTEYNVKDATARTGLESKADSSHTHSTSEVSGLDTALAAKAASTHTHETSEVNGLDTALANKQDTLTAGDNITIDENNVISSTGGGGSATVDSALSSSSENAVQNKVINAALAGKQATLTFDTTPTAGSTNPVTSAGIKTAIENQLSEVTVNAIPAGSVAIIDDLTTGGSANALSAEQGVNLKYLITGRKESATWNSGKYWNIGSSAAAGDTATSTMSTYSAYSCCIIEVRAGDVVDIYAQASSYQHTVIVTDTNRAILSLSGVKYFQNGSINITVDGYVYVNNQTTYVSSPVCRITTAGSDTKIAELNTKLGTSVYEGTSFYVPLSAGNMYPNTHTYYLHYSPSTTTMGVSNWLALPQGEYKVEASSLAIRIYQADTPLFARDYAVLDTNIYLTTISSGTESSRITISHKYIAFVVEAVGDNDLSALLQLTPTDITGAAADEPTNDKARVVAWGADSSTSRSFYLYLPVKDRYMVIGLPYWSASGYRMTHYGIDLFYLSDPDRIPYYSTEISRASEAECAINLVSTTHNGYVGGHMHYYEQTVDADTTIYIDGEYKEITDSWGAYVETMFELRTHSQIFETDNTTVIADVYKRWRIVDGKLHMFNRVVFAKAVHITQAQFSMFGVLRKIGDDYLTNRATRDDDTFVYATTDGWDTTATTENYAVLNAPVAGTTHQEQWGDMGYRFTQDILENNGKENAGMFINTNSGGTYNKMYYEIGSDFEVVQGDVLFSHAVLGIS